ncbi:hypothetical protein N7467_011123 [Penicillium canescens]|nr:hypothetical protein N7467_011123 [Penicillium canescens]
MNSLMTSAPLRAAVRPQYLHLAAQTCSGIAVTTLSSSLRTRSLNHTKRLISSTPQNQIKEFFPPPKSSNVKEVQSAWVHPVYTEAQMKDIHIAHREASNWSDWVALGTVRVFRWGMDFATGYRHPKAGEELPASFKMTEAKWLTRFIFLESVAGVPGMVGGMLRHLRSLRKMKRDNGWIETLLEEAFNERMHLLTFLKLAEPGWFMRLMVLGAQGVFFNGFFLAYLVSPLPEWKDLNAPEIAVQYWQMPEGQRKMRDLLMYVRADEAKHREVNHTLGNLNQALDPNPYQTEYYDPARDHPTKGIENIKPTGWDRKDIFDAKN